MMWGPLKLLKEKFPSTEDNSLNFLQFSSDFHTRDNLKQKKSSMIKRPLVKFEPGDKVLLLLPVPGKFLQALCS